MCGIHPYIVRANGKVTFLENERHHYTPICFALIHKQFLVDYPLAQFPYEYITAMIRSDFRKEGLSYVTSKRTMQPTFTSAYRFLGIKQNEVDLMRSAYSYKFPLYWLDAEKLLALVNRLRRQNGKERLRKLAPDMFTNLSKQTQKALPIAGITIKPSYMRELIDKFVPNVPELKITDAKKWYRSIDKILIAAKVYN